MKWQGNPQPTGIRNLDATSTAANAVDAFYDARADWTDEALMGAVAAGDEVAFAVLYDRYADLVYSASYRVLGDAQGAEDVAQDVFVRLWRRPEAFVAERGRFLSWLMSVTRNRAVDELRSRGRRRRRELPALESNEEHTALVCEGDDPCHAAQVREDQAKVRRALVDLPPEQKLVLELAYFGGLTQQEIALALHEPLGTVKTRVRLGMQKLRRALEDYR